MIGIEKRENPMLKPIIFLKGHNDKVEIGKVHICNESSNLYLQRASMDFIFYVLNLFSILVDVVIKYPTNFCCCFYTPINFIHCAFMNFLKKLFLKLRIFNLIMISEQIRILMLAPYWLIVYYSKSLYRIFHQGYVLKFI